MIRPTHTEKQLLDRLRSAEPSALVLARCSDAARCTQLFRALLLRAAGALRNGVTVMETILDRELMELPDPVRALVHLDRFLEASLNPTSVLEDLLRDPELLRRFFRLVSASRWLADTMVRDATLFRWLLTTDVLRDAPSPAAIAEKVGDAMQRFTPGPQRRNALRRLQRRELLRIAAADMLGFKDMPAVLAELSALADAVVTAAWEEACASHARRHDREVDATVAILALGKLGGRELNYSSDIDLMVVYRADDDAAGQRVTAALQETVRILTEVTPEGMLYRTDLRLRPDGTAGALSLSLSATLAYYETRGAPWERQMLLRGRPCAGDLRFGGEVLRALEPFVYPRTARQLPSELGKEVQRRLAERFSLADNVKHMRGGIRQIEFSLQALQMLHAPRLPELRTASTLQSIDALAAADLLTLEEEALLRDAYLFHRRVEHALQLEAFEQTHTLPADENGLQRVAWLLRLADVEEFTRRLEETRATVQRICTEMLVGDEAQDAAAQLPAAFRDAVKVRRLTEDITEGHGGRPHTSADRVRLRALLPVLLEESAGELLPDETLASLERFIHRARVPSAVIGILEQPPARRMLLRLACLAPVALRQLETDPLALELVFTGYDASRLDAQRLQRVRDIGALGSFLLGDMDFPTYSETLTHTADHILRGALAAQEAEASMPPFVVLALGKYGGNELIPGSDLDVIFLSGDGSAEERAAAQKHATRLIAVLQNAGGAGRLYDVDARLRPEGGSAPLVVTREAWLRYHEGRASVWEVQSLLRTRVAAGDAQLAATVEEDIRAMLSAMRFTAAERDEIRGMREAMEPTSRIRQTEYIDIKRSAGGLVDCEFAVQLLALSGGMRDAGNTDATLLRMQEAYPELASPLTRMHACYRKLRRLQLLFRVLLDVPGNLFPSDAAQRTTLAAATGHADAAVQLDALQKDMRQNRKDFDSICTALSSHDRSQEH